METHLACRLAVCATASLGLALLTGCSSTGPSGSTASAVAPAGSEATHAEEQAEYSQAFSPLGECHWDKSIDKFHRIVKSASVVMNSGNNGFCTYPLFAGNGGDFSSVMVTSHPQHGLVKFLSLTHRLMVGYRPDAGYVGADGFDITVTRPDGLSIPVNTMVTVTNPGVS